MKNRRTVYLGIVFGAASLAILSNDSMAQQQNSTTSKQTRPPLLLTNPLDTRVAGSTPSRLPPKQPAPAQAQPQTFSNLPRTEIRQATREEIIQARARQIYNDKMSRDPRIISVQTGPTATQYFLTYLRAQMWSESLEQASREVR